MTAKKTTQAPEGPEPVKVSGLPDGRVGQVAEASLEETPFLMEDGSTFVFQASARWSLETVIAYTNGSIGTWLSGALKNDGDLAKIATQPAVEVGRIMRYYDDHMGVSRGESPSSSTS